MARFILRKRQIYNTDPRTVLFIISISSEIKFLAIKCGCLLWSLWNNRTDHLSTTTTNIGHNFLEHRTQDPWTLFLQTIFSCRRTLAPKMRRQTKQGRLLRPFVRRAGWIITAQICTNSFTPSNLMYALARSGHGELYQGSVQVQR